MTGILVIGSLDDSTISYFVNQLCKVGIRIDYIDIARSVLTGDWEDRNGAPFISVGGCEYAINSYQGIFYRYVPLPPACVDEEHRQRADQFLHWLHGRLDHTSLAVSTRTGRNFHNFSKALHLNLLSQVVGTSRIGIPETIMSNNTAMLERFAARHDFDLICKGVSGAKTWALGIDRESFYERLKYTGSTPVLLQRRIHGWECRVHVVGDRTFAERIESSHVDYRRKQGTHFARANLPLYVQRYCVNISRKLGCMFMGIDFKVDADGQWYILEANSMPCYQGYDRRAKGAITEALIDALTAR
jgi:hypothetical protein